jgi:hypothetical protein
MPKAPPNQDPADDRAGAAPIEGPAPPGVDAPPAVPPDLAVPDPRALPADELRARAADLGVTPAEGSGAGGNVIRSDLEAAVAGVPAPPPIPDPPIGRPPLAWVAESSAAAVLPAASEEE